MNRKAQKLFEMKTKKTVLLILLTGMQIPIIIYLTHNEIIRVNVLHEHYSIHKNIYKLIF